MISINFSRHVSSSVLFVDSFYVLMQLAILNLSKEDDATVSIEMQNSPVLLCSLYNTGMQVWGQGLNFWRVWEDAAPPLID